MGTGIRESASVSLTQRTKKDLGTMDHSGDQSVIESTPLNSTEKKTETNAKDKPQDIATRL